MSELLPNFVAGHWQAGIANGTPLFDPVLGTELVRVDAVVELASSHGRVHIISPDVAALHTGHGNGTPQSLHGAPDRAGGGEELGGLRALNFYHRRAAIHASTTVLATLR